MKIKFPLYVLVLLIFSCAGEQKLAVETQEFKTTACDACLDAQLNLPRFTDETDLAKTINSTLDAEVIALLNFNDEVSLNSVGDALEAFEASFTELKTQYGDDMIPWEANIEGKVFYETDSLVTLQMQTYMFTGGAHGYSAVNFLNFSKQAALLLAPEDLFVALDEFKKLAEQEFRKQEKIPADKPINHTGLMFEDDVFQLPANIGYGPEGLLLWYNQYEIASYADGPITLTLPYEKVNPYLVVKGKLANK
ncbi:DUF3298 and DUF4163 domain-containing protein [Croceivirga radicis]|uniref:DUF3298 and DUF4163 domain-containing protein n=1 Tax=Croceivirga radicis TaxID=1929488 RepID=UPI000255B169|nr:DUF3298 and DUF4163 domain-containing protein [Croceivirga radicis]